MRSFLVAALLAVLAFGSGCIQINVGTQPEAAGHTVHAAPASSSQTTTVQVEQAELSVDFTWRPANPRTNQTVLFQASLSGLAEGQTVTDWVWLWGDGKSTTWRSGDAGSGAAQSHVWKVADLDGYDVTLRVMSSDGRIAERTHEVLVLNS